MIFPEFLHDREVQRAAKEYTNRREGRFYGAEPGSLLIYETEDFEHSYYCPVDDPPEKVIADLRSGKLLSELWPELEDPDEDTVQ